MRIIILALLLPVSIMAMPEDSESEMFVEVHILPATGFTVVGLEYTGDSPEAVMALWEGFVQRIDEIPRGDYPDDAYGVITGFDETTGEFSYLACVESDMSGPLPEGMIELNIPPGTYAVFDFPFFFLEDIYNFAYYEWLPASGFTHGDGYDFEFYPEDFEPTEQGVLMQLYVSIEEVE